MIPKNIENLSIAKIHTLDLNFLNSHKSIAAYAIEHDKGIILVECGPSSTLSSLFNELDKYGYAPESITDVFITHIHLDHSGAVGFLANRGARIYVHPKGAPHLIDPDKLLSSARRIYGNMMETLWGDYEKVPEKQLSITKHGDTIKINNVKISTYDTPGHAEHHNIYLFEDICFSGDIGGIRLNQSKQVILPTPPPEFHLEKWRDSLEMMLNLGIRYIIPTHFGIYDDAEEHIQKAINFLDDLNVWLIATMPFSLSFEDFKKKYSTWLIDRLSNRKNLNQQSDQYELINPLGMSASGIYRYWNKNRNLIPEK